MAVRVDRAILRRRQETYLAEHYVGVHVTAVNIALGMAGLAAASLLTPPKPQFEQYQQLFWLLWAASLVATGVAYGGTMSGAILLPARMPAIADLLLPLLLSVSEFLLFGALAYQITGFTQPDQVLIVWWFALGAFGAIAFGSVWRVHYLVRRGVYSYELQETIRWYRRRLESDMAGAGLTSVAAILVAIYYLSF